MIPINLVGLFCEILSHISLCLSRCFLTSQLYIISITGYKSLTNRIFGYNKPDDEYEQLVVQWYN